MEFPISSNVLSSTSWLEEVPESRRDAAKREYEKAEDFKARTEAMIEWHPKSRANALPITSLAEYFRYIQVIATKPAWFRGESRDHGHLVPKLFRNIESDELVSRLEMERQYFLEFCRRSRAWVSESIPSNPWAMYFLIQHYGGPTRLLDWTEDAAVALYFAVEDDKYSTSDAVVLHFAPSLLSTVVKEELEIKDRVIQGPLYYPGEFPTENWISNLISNDKDPSGSIPNSPIAILPPYTDPRIAAQRSCFTLFGKQQFGLLVDGEELKCPCCTRKIVSRLTIDGNSKRALRNELANIGMTSGRIYPGLQGLCKEISDEVL